MLPNVRYRICKSLRKDGKIAICREPAKGECGYKAWRSWEPNWETSTFAASPFIDIDDEYYEFEDIPREEVEKIINDFTKSKG